MLFKESIPIPKAGPWDPPRLQNLPKDRSIPSRSYRLGAEPKFAAQQHYGRQKAPHGASPKQLPRVPVTQSEMDDFREHLELVYFASEEMSQLMLDDLLDISKDFEVFTDVKDVEDFAVFNDYKDVKDVVPQWIPSNFTWSNPRAVGYPIAFSFCGGNWMREGFAVDFDELLLGFEDEYGLMLRVAIAENISFLSFVNQQGFYWSNFVHSDTRYDWTKADKIWSGRRTRMSFLVVTRRTWEQLGESYLKIQGNTFPQMSEHKGIPRILGALMQTRWKCGPGRSKDWRWLPTHVCSGTYLSYPRQRRNKRDRKQKSKRPPILWIEAYVSNEDFVEKPGELFEEAMNPEDVLDFENEPRSDMSCVRTSCMVPYENYVGSIIGSFFRIEQNCGMDNHGTTYLLKDVVTSNHWYQGKAYNLSGISRKLHHYRTRVAQRHVHRVKLCWQLRQNGHHWVIWKLQYPTESFEDSKKSLPLCDFSYENFPPLSGDPHTSEREEENGVRPIMTSTLPSENTRNCATPLPADKRERARLKQKRKRQNQRIGAQICSSPSLWLQEWHGRCKDPVNQIGEFPETHFWFPALSSKGNVELILDFRHGNEYIHHLVRSAAWEKVHISFQRGWEIIKSQGELISRSTNLKINGLEVLDIELSIDYLHNWIGRK